MDTLHPKPILKSLATALQRLPPAFPGKARLARILLRSQLGREDVDVLTRAGVVLRVPSLAEPIAFHLLIDGVYEPQLLKFLLDALPLNGVFVDVGANIGSFSVTIAKLRPDARVIAIEPSPAVLPYLQHNVKSNQVGNVEIVSLAAYSHGPSSSFTSRPTRTSAWGRSGRSFMSRRFAWRRIDWTRSWKRAACGMSM